MSQSEPVYEYEFGDDINVNLIAAVSAVLLEEVERWLKSGAEPNWEHSAMPLQYDPYIPRTALTILVFRISDCMLSDNQMHKYAAIARMLIQHGAVTTKARELSEARYGPYVFEETDENLMKTVLRIIHNDDQRKKSIRTGYVYDEMYMWHDAGKISFSNWIEPEEAWENPATKRRMHSLLAVSGMLDSLVTVKPRPALQEELCRFHTVEYVTDTQKRSEETGYAFEEVHYAKGGYDIAALCAGGVLAAGTCMTL